MNVVLWIIAGLLALLFLTAGLMKSTQPKEKLLANPSMGWTKDFSPAQLRAIGIIELLAAIGLILPALVDIAPILVPLAAAGLVIVMIGAIVVHLRRKETQPAGFNAVLLVLAAVLAIFRFGPNAF
ncbi:DoxX family protein [Kribbella sp. NBC_01245]|uniref:DoxX family protein n=1 Tax=Kribbella sp. NBC_01245 TaxID=2903578 RepID=UPI002E2E7167|nr:DoxX family protein [Kribbella sp. NBC_01245]